MPAVATESGHAPILDQISSRLRSARILLMYSFRSSSHAAPAHPARTLTTTSTATPGSSSRWSRNSSRRRRLHRARTTAPPTRRVAVTPMRLGASPRFRRSTKTTMYRPAARAPSSYTFRYCARRRSRASRGKRNPASHGKPLAALATSRAEHLAPRLGAHPHAKSVGLLAPPVIRLKSPFHDPATLPKSRARHDIVPLFACQAAARRTPDTPPGRRDAERWRNSRLLLHRSLC